MFALLMAIALQQPLPRPTTATQVQQVQTQGQGSWQRWADSVDAKFKQVGDQFKQIDGYRDEMVDTGKLLQGEIEASQDAIEDLKNKIKAMQLREQEKERAAKETP